MKTERENRTSKLIYLNKNGTVRYLAVSTHTLGPVNSRRVRCVCVCVWGGWWQWKISLQPLYVTCTASGVTGDREQSLFCLVDQHRKLSYLAGASSCFSTQGTVSPASHTKFEPVRCTGDLIIFTGTRGTFTCKNWHMPVRRRLCIGYRSGLTEIARAL